MGLANQQQMLRRLNEILKRTLVKKIPQTIVMLIASRQQLVGKFILSLPRTPMEKILTKLIMVLVLRTQMAMILKGTQESPYISY